MSHRRARFYSEFLKSERKTVEKPLGPAFAPGICSTLGRLDLYTLPLTERSSGPMRRTSLFILVLAVTATLAPLRAQQELKRRPGNFLIYGPVHTIRDERVTFTRENGVPVEGPKVLVLTITYSEDGTKQERTFYGPPGVVIRAVDIFDPDGRILETSNFSRSDVLNNRVVSNYNDQKELIERITYRRDGSVSNRTVFRSHGNQRESESWLYDFNGGIISQSKTTNDVPAKRADSTSIDARGLVQTQSTITDNTDGSREFKTESSNGDYKREVIAPGGKGSEDRTTYNKDGTIKSKERYIREFDSYRNLIKTTHLTANGDSQDFEPADVTYRTITYYGKD
jgi:antitoxin component YwqK of YwqJK toxin-antitoxin module